MFLRADGSTRKAHDHDLAPLHKHIRQDEAPLMATARATLSSATNLEYFCQRLLRAILPEAKVLAQCEVAAPSKANVARLLGKIRCLVALWNIAGLAASRDSCCARIELGKCLAMLLLSRG